MNTALIGSLLLFFALSIPVAIAIALASIFGITFVGHGSLLSVPKNMFTGIAQFPLMAVPFFILAGNLMTKGGISSRLVNFAKSIIGGTQGGLASTCVLACMIFAAISGSSIATTFAIGSILIPAMIKHGYPVEMAGSIQASSAELGVIIPPSVPLILFAVSTGTSLPQLFIAALVPGLLVAGALVLMVQIWSRVKGYGKEDGKDSVKILPSFKNAFWALLMPVIILGGIYSGWFTPTEAAAVSVVYALIVGLFIYREMKFSDLPEIFRSAAVSSGAVMLIISAAYLFSHLIAKSSLPNDLGMWAQENLSVPWKFLLMVNILLFFVGMFVETSAAILVLGPILTPVAISFGIDPVHFGVIIVVNLALGMFTPPLGVNLFAAAQVAEIPVQRLFKTLVIPVTTVVLALMVITYVPWLSLFLRDIFM